MKMTQEHYLELSKAIAELIKKHPEGEFETYKANFPDHSNTRYRWNLFHSVNLNRDNFPFRKLSDYLNDKNIDTALRKITNTK